MSAQLSSSERDEFGSMIQQDDGRFVALYTEAGVERILAARMPAEWYDDRRNLAIVARHMGECGDSVDDVAYMLEKPEKFDDVWRAAWHGDDA